MVGHASIASSHSQQALAMISSLLGRAFQFLIALLSVRVMTTMLSPTEVGKVALITTLVNFCVLFLISPLGTFINRRLHSWQDSGRIKTYFGWYALYLLAVSSVCAPLTMLAVQAGWWSLDVGVLALGLVVWVSILFGTVHQTLIPSLNLLGRDKPFAVLSVLSPALGLGLSCLLIRTGGGAVATQWLTGVVLSQLVFSIVAARVFFRGDTSRFHREFRLNVSMFKTAWRFAWPVSIAVACSWLHFQGYRFLLVDAVGLEELGFFVAGYGIAASLFAALEQILTTWFMPRFYRQLNQNSQNVGESAWARYAGSVLPLSVLALAALLSMSEELVQWMLGPAFQNTQQYVRWGALAEWTRVVAGIYALVVHQHMRTHYLIIPHLIGAVVAFTIIGVFASSGRMDMVPVGLTAGNLLLIGILRWSQGGLARLEVSGVRLVVLALVSALLVSLLDFVLRRGGFIWWTSPSLIRMTVLSLIWFVVGLWLLRWILSALNR